jgi:hypothetical protein
MSSSQELRVPHYSAETQRDLPDILHCVPVVHTQQHCQAYDVCYGWHLIAVGRTLPGHSLAHNEANVLAYVRFDITTAVTTKSTIFRNVMPCDQVVYRLLGYMVVHPKT